MFLHIGNNYILDEKNVIGIYNIDAIKETIEYKNLIKEMEKKHCLIRDVNLEEKSFIMTKEKDKIVGYISNISSTTIAKRSQMNIKKNIERL